jgi:hypothetical protein
VVLIILVTICVHRELEGSVQRELQGSVRLGLEHNIPATKKRGKSVWTLDISDLSDFSDISDLSDIWTLGHMDTWTLGLLDILIVPSSMSNRTGLTNETLVLFSFLF